MVQGNKIKIRREGIFLCLDGSAENIQDIENSWKRVYEFIRKKCSVFDIPLKLGMLGWENELSGLPDNQFHAKHFLQHRGRFITPVLEKQWTALQKTKFDLLLLSSEKIYDWDDWQEEIEKRFNKVHILDPHELNQMTQLDIEEWMSKRFFNFKIHHVSITLNECFCSHLPEGFKIKIRNGKCELYNNDFNNQRIDIVLSVFGVQNKGSFTLNACHFTVKGPIQYTPAEIVAIDKTLSDSDKILFKHAISQYQKEEHEHDCPLCSAAHRFKNALICSEKKSLTRLFSTESLIFDQIEKRRTERTKHVLFWERDDNLYWEIFEKPILCIAKNKFIIVPDDGVISYIKLSSGMEIFDLKKIHNKLYNYSDNNMYILKI